MVDALAPMTELDGMQVLQQAQNRGRRWSFLIGFTGKGGLKFANDKARALSESTICTVRRASDAGAALETVTLSGALPTYFRRHPYVSFPVGARFVRA